MDRAVLSCRGVDSDRASPLPFNEGANVKLNNGSVVMLVKTFIILCVCAVASKILANA